MLKPQTSHLYSTCPSWQVMKFINHMKLDPDEIVSVEDIAPPSEDGTVVLTRGGPGIATTRLR